MLISNLLQIDTLPIDFFTYDRLVHLLAVLKSARLDLAAGAPRASAFSPPQPPSSLSKSLLCAPTKRAVGSEESTLNAVALPLSSYLFRTGLVPFNVFHEHIAIGD